MNDSRWLQYLSVQSLLVSEQSLPPKHIPDETKESTDSHDHPKNGQTPSHCALQSYKFTMLPVKEYWLIYRGIGLRLYDLAPSLPPHPPSPVGMLSVYFLRVAGRAYWQKRGEGAGEEPNHTTARKPCPLSVMNILCSLLSANPNFLISRDSIWYLQKCGICVHKKLTSRYLCYDFFVSLKGLSHEIDFKNVDENGQILALIRAAAGFWIFRKLLWFFVEKKHQFRGKC